MDHRDGRRPLDIGHHDPLRRVETKTLIVLVPQGVLRGGVAGQERRQVGKIALRTYRLRHHRTDAQNPKHDRATHCAPPGARVRGEGNLASPHSGRKKQAGEWRPAHAIPARLLLAGPALSTRCSGRGGGPVDHTGRIANNRRFERPWSPAPGPCHVELHLPQPHANRLRQRHHRRTGETRPPRRQSPPALRRRLDPAQRRLRPGPPRPGRTCPGRTRRHRGQPALRNLPRRGGDGAGREGRFPPGRRRRLGHRRRQIHGRRGRLSGQRALGFDPRLVAAPRRPCAGLPSSPCPAPARK